MTTAAFLPGFVCMTAFAVNFVAIYYHAARAIPFGTMMVILCIWIFVVLPLTLVGAVIGRNVAGTPDHPCRISPIPRPIPEKKWFMEPSVIVMIGGVLPFGSIFIEMYFIFTSFWAYKIYYVSGYRWTVVPPSFFFGAAEVVLLFLGGFFNKRFAPFASFIT